MKRAAKRRTLPASIKASSIPISEHSIQATLVAILEYKLRPGVVRIAIPNGGLRKIRVAMKLKDEGVQPGAPDLLFAVESGQVIWLELKNAKGGLSDAQIGMHAKLRALGHLVGVANSVDKGLEFLRMHGLLRP
jgi:hypothetical protein